MYIGIEEPGPRTGWQVRLATCGRAYTGINERGNDMGTNEVEQPEVESAESKTKGRWWHGAIAGGLMTLLASELFIGGGAGLYLISAFFFVPLLGGLGGFLVSRKSTFAPAIVGGLFGLVPVYPLWHYATNIWQ